MSCPPTGTEATGRGGKARLRRDGTLLGPSPANTEVAGRGGKARLRTDGTLVGPVLMTGALKLLFGVFLGCVCIEIAFAFSRISLASSLARSRRTRAWPCARSRINFACSTALALASAFALIEASFALALSFSRIDFTCSMTLARFAVRVCSTNTFAFTLAFSWACCRMTRALLNASVLALAFADTKISCA